MKKNILSIVKQYVDNSSDPRKHNIMNPLKEDFEETVSIKNIIAELGFPEQQYCNGLIISSDSDFHINIKRAQNACFVNNVFTEGLQAWKKTLI